MQEKISPLTVFISAFGVSSFAGIAALLRGGKVVNWVSLISAALNSGLFGTAIAMIWFTKYQDNIYFLIGVCILGGLGGATVIDFTLEAAKKKGLSIFGVSFSKEPEKEGKDEQPESKQTG